MPDGGHTGLPNEPTALVEIGRMLHRSQFNTICELPFFIIYFYFSTLSLNFCLGLKRSIVITFETSIHCIAVKSSSIHILLLHSLLFVFNCMLNLLDFADHPPTDDFFNAALGCGFHPLITKPTRITPHSATLIDNILTNSILDTTAGILYSDISDHYPLFQITTSCLESSDSFQKTFLSRDINRTSISSFKQCLSNINWSYDYQAQDSDSAYDTFLSIFSSHYNSHFPLTLKTVRTKKITKPWITQSIVSSCHFKNRLHKRFL